MTPTRLYSDYSQTRRGRAHVWDYGAKGDGITDDTAALRAAIQTGLPLEFGVGKTYIVSDDIGQNKDYSTSPLDWEGSNSTVFLDTGTHRANLCRIRITNGQSGLIKGITFDANQNAHQGLSIENNTLDMNSANELKLIDVFGNRAYRRNTDFPGGSGIFIRGAFSRVLIQGGGVRDCTLAEGAGTSGSVGIAGITVTHYSLTRYPREVIFDGITIDKIYSEDSSWTVDQDGVVAFSPHNASGSSGTAIESVLIVKNSTFRNCWGRSIKSQMFFNTVESCRFYRDEGNANKVGNIEVGFQISGGSVSNCTFFYKNAQVPGNAAVSFSSSNIAGTPYDLSSCTVRDCKFYIEDGTGFRECVNTFPSGSIMGPITIERVDVFGKTRSLFEHLVNGDGVNNTSTIRDCYVSELSGYTDPATGKLALIRVRASGATSPYTATVIVENCVYGGNQSVGLVQHQVAGTSATATLYHSNNRGFTAEFA